MAAERLHKRYGLRGDKIDFPKLHMALFLIVCLTWSLLYVCSKYHKLLSQFNGVVDFEQAESEAGELLDTYITGAVRLAWMMITRIPPMIATEPKNHVPHLTLLQECSEGELVSQQTISLRPILFFSYEGQVAVEGIVITPGWVATIKSRFEKGMSQDSKE